MSDARMRLPPFTDRDRISRCPIVRSPRSPALPSTRTQIAVKREPASLAHLRGNRGGTVAHMLAALYSPGACNPVCRGLRRSAQARAPGLLC